MIRIYDKCQESKNNLKLEAPEFNDEEIRKANRILSQIADVVENAFSEFDTEWDSKPSIIDRKNIDGELFVHPLNLTVNISGLLFSFRASLSNPFRRSFEKPKVTFTFKGSEMRTINVTPMMGAEITGAAKIAYRLQKEISAVLKDYE